MIDDPNEVLALIAKMKNSLPIPAYPTKNLCHSLKGDKNIKLKSKNLLEITEVLNMGDEGGIICATSYCASKELLMLSLTHLRIKTTHPLAKDIKRYQVKRIRALRTNRTAF